jgi:hypothetical protein
MCDGIAKALVHRRNPDISDTPGQIGPGGTHQPPVNWASDHAHRVNRAIFPDRNPLKGFAGVRPVVKDKMTGT